MNFQIIKVGKINIILKIECLSNLTKKLYIFHKKYQSIKIFLSKHLSNVNVKKGGSENRWLVPIYILNDFDGLLKTILHFVKIDRDESSR